MPWHRVDSLIDKGIRIPVVKQIDYLLTPRHSYILVTQPRKRPVSVLEHNHPE
ncbi:MAG: hypothetical protein L6R35_003313 [Caloplaca aegaea]|nr:MAG: hypothetical protein L6R35_003313 [Caloplaca aegaea]